MAEPSQTADGGYLSITRGAPSKPNWTGLFALLFKHSSCQQPLVASALAKIAEDPEQREAIAGTEGAIQQLLSMVLSENLHVVREACRRGGHDAMRCGAAIPPRAGHALVSRRAAAAGL